MGRWGVIFDHDGTMVDNTAAHKLAWIEFLNLKGFSITTDYYDAEIHGRTNEIIIKKVFGSDVPPESMRQLANEKEIIYRKNFGPILKETPGFSLLVKDLSWKGISLVVASNAPVENIELTMGKLGLAHYFFCILSEQDFSKGKPDPEAFQLAAHRLKLPLDRCLIFEDSTSGFRAAESAGAPYIAITHGANELDCSSDFKPRAVYSDFTSLNFEILEHMMSS